MVLKSNKDLAGEAHCRGFLKALWSSPSSSPLLAHSHCSLSLHLRL